MSNDPLLLSLTTIAEHSSLPKTSIPLVHLHCSRHPSGLTMANVDVCFIFWLKIQATPESSGCLFASDHRESWGALLWDDLHLALSEILWKLVEWGMASTVFSKALADISAAGLCAIKVAANGVELSLWKKDAYSIMNSEITTTISAVAVIGVFSY